MKENDANVQCREMRIVLFRFVAKSTDFFLFLGLLFFTFRNVA